MGSNVEMEQVKKLEALKSHLKRLKEKFPRNENLSLVNIDVLSSVEITLWDNYTKFIFELKSAKDVESLKTAVTRFRDALPDRRSADIHFIALLVSTFTYVDAKLQMFDSKRCDEVTLLKNVASIVSQEELISIS